MGMTHDAFAVQAFKRLRGRAPGRSLDLEKPDEAWIQEWKADYRVKLCRDPSYATRFARRTAWLRRRAARLRLAAVNRAT